MHLRPAPWRQRQIGQKQLLVDIQAVQEHLQLLVLLHPCRLNVICTPWCLHHPILWLLDPEAAGMREIRQDQKS